MLPWCADTVYQHKVYGWFSPLSILHFQWYVPLFRITRIIMRLKSCIRYHFYFILVQSKLISLVNNLHERTMHRMFFFLFIVSSRHRSKQCHRNKRNLLSHLFNFFRVKILRQRQYNSIIRTWNTQIAPSYIWYAMTTVRVHIYYINMFTDSVRSTTICDMMTRRALYWSLLELYLVAYRLPTARRPMKLNM